MKSHKPFPGHPVDNNKQAIILMHLTLKLFYIILNHRIVSLAWPWHKKEYSEKTVTYKYT